MQSGKKENNNPAKNRPIAKSILFFFPLDKEPFRYFYVLYVFGLLIVPLFYIAYTGHIWEDYFITFKFSENLTEGHGLVYEPGKRVHGFTSPIGVLLPAFCHFISGKKSYLISLWLFRVLFCLPAFVFAGLFFLKIFQSSENCKRHHAIFASLFFLLEAKSVVYSVNGMETAFMLLFVSIAFYSLQLGIDKSWLISGISWGGIMWTRPDGFIYIGILGLASLIMRRFKLERSFILGNIKSAILCAVIYLPWFLWAWYYYGTPVPNTIMAKGALMSHYGILQFFEYSLRKLPYAVIWVFSPIYVQLTGWPFRIIVFCGLLGIFCFFYWLIPIKDFLGRFASLVFFLLCFYLGIMFFPYPWYYPSVAFFGLIAIVCGIFAISEKFFKPIVAYSIMSFVCAINIYLFACITQEMKLQQEIIENKHRQKIGEWLKKNVSQDERIYLECIGYIGYFSNARLYDYPGLVSPEVVRLIREKNLNFQTLVPELEPDWILARTMEYASLVSIPYFNENYRLVKIFNVGEEIEKVDFLPGEGYLLYDSCIYVFKKNTNRGRHDQRGNN